MKITWFGQSAYALEFGKTKILIDPFLRDNPSFKGQNFDKAIDGATHIALTHGHSDHLGDTIEIAKITGATVLSSFDLCRWLQHRGVEKIDPGNTGGTLHHEGFSITFVQAKHSSCFIDEQGISHAMGHCNGFVFHIEGEKSIYHMGDTDIFGDMALIQELHQPQIGLVPIGDRFTMGSAVAALACRRYFKFETIMPNHFGSFPILEQSPDAFIRAMEEDAKKVVVPEIGEAVEV